MQNVYVGLQFCTIRLSAFGLSVPTWEFYPPIGRPWLPGLKVGFGQRPSRSAVCLPSSENEVSPQHLMPSSGYRVFSGKTLRKPARVAPLSLSVTYVGTCWCWQPDADYTEQKSGNTVTSECFRLIPDRPRQKNRLRSFALPRAILSR